MKNNNTSTVLNSERLAQRYGNYGIDVLYDDNSKRLSSLFSEDAGGKIMRTMAMVEYTAADDPRLAVEQQRICAGESLGAVFKEHGWAICKISSKLSEGLFDLDALPQLSQMSIEMPATLTTHSYIFQIRKNGSSIDYAMVTEIHHPDYLRRADLALPAD